MNVSDDCSVIQLKCYERNRNRTALASDASYDSEYRGVKMRSNGFPRMKRGRAAANTVSTDGSNSKRGEACASVLTDGCFDFLCKFLFRIREERGSSYSDGWQCEGLCRGVELQTEEE